NRGRSGLGAFKDSIVVDWCSAGSFKSKYSRKPARAIQSAKLNVSAPVRGRVSSVPDRKQVQVRGIPQCIDDFEGGSLLSLESIRIDRIDDCDARFTGKVAHQFQTVIKVPI